MISECIGFLCLYTRGDIAMNNRNSGHSIQPGGLIHLFVVYFVWSTTYLAIKLGVGSGSGIGPFYFISGRVFCASLILFAIAFFRKEQLKIGIRDFWPLLSGAVFLWAMGNGFIVIAEQKISSGFAGIIVASAPVWAALIDSLFTKKAPRPLIMTSIVLSFCGLAIVLRGEILRGLDSDPFSVIIALAGTISWAFGMNIQKRFPARLGSIAASAYQQFFAGILVALIALISKEALPAPNPAALWAWLYLIVVGSVIAFTSFIKMVKLLPITLATTYAYVNPVFALILGFLFLGEKIDGYTVAGMLIVLAGIAGIYYGQFSAHDKAELRRGIPVKAAAE